MHRLIFMEDHIPERPDRSLLIDRQTSKWSLWDVVSHENDSIFLKQGLTQESLNL